MTVHSVGVLVKDLEVYAEISRLSPSLSRSRLAGRAADAQRSYPAWTLRLPQQACSTFPQNPDSWIGERGSHHLKLTLIRLTAAAELVNDLQRYRPPSRPG